MKEKFNQLIADVVKPLLKQNGFTKKGMNFYKRKDDLIFLINFQNSHGNTFDQTEFYVNCGIHSTNIDKVIGRGELLEPKEYDCYFGTRISSITKSPNDGYIITEETDLHPLNLTINKDLKAVIVMFENVKQTSDLTDLMIDKNGLNNYKELFEYLLLTDNQTDIKRFVKHLHITFGNEKRWTIFESNLTELLKENARKETIIDILNNE
ncbi:DUF4304 domain-containing protein [Flavobacterium pedocola]